MTSDPWNDASLKQLAQKLRVEPSAPDLWNRIEASLDESSDEWLERNLAADITGAASGPAVRVPWLASALVAVVLGIGVSLVLRTRGEIPNPLLQPVEKLAIHDQQERLDEELARLRSQWVATTKSVHTLLLDSEWQRLDDNLDLCREAALRNPDNRWVRQSLLRSTQRNVEMLRTMLKGAL